MKTFFISVCESSSDHHAANLIKHCPEFKFVGMGGSLSQKAGLEVLVDSNDLGCVGITDIFVKLKKNLQALNHLKKAIKGRTDIDTILVFDSPEFNLRLAKYAKELGKKIIYIAPPQVWAWRSSRIHIIKKYVDHVVCLFPFEKAVYKHHLIPHSLAHNPSLLSMEESQIFSQQTHCNTIALLPGSRSSEIKRNLPIMLEACFMNKAFQQKDIIIVESDDCHKKLIQSLVHEKYKKIKIIEREKLHQTPVLFAVATSGTVCLELAICLVPTIAIYKTSWITYFIGKALVDLTYFTLPNLIANEEIVTELISPPPNSITLHQHMVQLKNPSTLKSKIDSLKKVKEKLKSNDGSIANILKKWVSDASPFENVE